MSTGADIRGTVRLLRETKGLTQRQVANAAGVSLSTVRRLEREDSARFHEATEHRIELALGLRRGGLELLRTGESVDQAFAKGSRIRLPRSYAYPEAPLSDIAVADSYVATVLAHQLEKLLSHRSEEITLLATGRLVAGSGPHPGAWLCEWLPWPARMQATPMWLDRFMDSAEQLQHVLAKATVPYPLRIAEAVAMQIAYDRAWSIDTNAFFDSRTGEEIDDPLDGLWDDLFEYADPRPLFDREDPAHEWVEVDSSLHPARWWLQPVRSAA